MDIKELAAKKRLSDPQKAFLRSKAADLGIEFVDKGNCQSCYTDLALQIYNAEKPKNEEKQSDFPTLKPNIDIIFMGNRVNEATITHEMASLMLSVGLKKYFDGVEN